VRVGRGCLGTGLGEVPSSSLASLGLLRASQAEKAMNHEVNWEASPAKTGQVGFVVSMAETGEDRKRRKKKGRRGKGG